MDVYKFYKKTLWEQRGYDILFPDLVVDEFGFQVLTNPELEFNNFSGTIGLIHKLSDKSKLFLNHAIASRAPNPSELFSEGLHHAIARIEIGDLRFKSEVGHKTSLTYEYLGKNLNFSINPFINNIEDFILIEPVELVETIRGNFPSWEYRQTNAQLFGVDVDASLKINDLLSLNHQLSIVKGYDKDRDLPLINMPPISTKNEISYNNKNLNNLKINLESEFVFAQNEYPDNNFEIFLPFTQTAELLDVSTPPDAYHLINLNSSIDFKVTENSSLAVGLRVTNLFNTSYRNYLNLLRFYSDDLGRNFLLNLKFNY
jgi:iron complex outermembrane receptor protein